MRTQFGYQYTGGPFRLKISGHSGFSKKGSDIVCSAVSVLFYTFQRSIVETAGEKIKISSQGDEQTVELQGHDFGEKALTVLRVIMTGLEGVRENYPDNIEILIQGD
jgi:uncharacterized protein